MVKTDLWPVEKDKHFMGIFSWFNSLRRVNSSADYYQKGLHLGRQKKLREAVDHFTEALKISPSFVQARIARANTYFLMEEWDQAISDFSTILEAYPGSVDALIGRASIYASKAASLVERYNKMGGKQYQLSFEEINMPMNQLLKSVNPEKAMWIRLTNTLMELQFAVKQDAEKAIKLDP